MGQYYKIVNVKKREYLNPHMFNEGLKLMEFGMSAGGSMTALAVLLSNGCGRGGGDLHSENEIVGSWAGDPIVIAGDYGDDGKFLPEDKQDRCLYSVAEEEGTDISAKILDALMEDRYFAEEFIKNWNEFAGWKASDSYYKDVVEVVDKWDKYYKQQLQASTPVSQSNQSLPNKINSYSVIGSKGDNYDVVDLNDGTDVWTCTCPAYQYNKVPGTDCKHIKEVKQKLKTA